MAKGYTKPKDKANKKPKRAEKPSKGFKPFT